MLNLELLSNTVNSNGNYNDDTIYRREKNLQLAFFGRTRVILINIFLL